MKYIKNVILGGCVAGLNLLGLFLNKADNCTGFCKTCGGRCLNGFFIMPLLGGILLVIRKIKIAK